MRMTNGGLQVAEGSDTRLLKNVLTFSSIKTTQENNNRSRFYTFTEKELVPNIRQKIG